jgi:hypothetical protein
VTGEFLSRRHLVERQQRMSVSKPRQRARELANVTLDARGRRHCGGSAAGLADHLLFDALVTVKDGRWISRWTFV